MTNVFVVAVWIPGSPVSAIASPFTAWVGPSTRATWVVRTVLGVELVECFGQDDFVHTVLGVIIATVKIYHIVLIISAPCHDTGVVAKAFYDILSFYADLILKSGFLG